MTQNADKNPRSEPLTAPSSSPDTAAEAQRGERADFGGTDLIVPASGALDGPAGLAGLVAKARDYAAKATAENTNIAYAKDWAHFSSWCRRHGAEPLPPSPQTIGLYITDCAATGRGSPALSVATIERRLSGLSWNYKQRGLLLDRGDPHIATVLAGIRRQHGKPPAQKEAVLAEHILEMVSALSSELRDLRDRAILLIGYAGGLRRSEIVGLDVGHDDTEDGRGWVEIEKGGAVAFIKSKTGWREIEIGRGSADTSCPVHALEQWLHFGKIVHGPIFRRVSRDNKSALADRLSDKHVARLVKRCVAATGIGPEVGDAERVFRFSGHSLRSGLASSAEVDERYVQKQLGHASAEMTRRYQRRRDRFRVNLTKAAGL